MPTWSGWSSFPPKYCNRHEQNGTRKQKQVRITCCQEVALLVALIMTLFVGPLHLLADFAKTVCVAKGPVNAVKWYTCSIFFNRICQVFCTIFKNPECRLHLTQIYLLSHKLTWVKFSCSRNVKQHFLRENYSLYKICVMLCETSWYKSKQLSCTEIDSFLPYF